MRLKAHELGAIVDVFRPFLDGAAGELYLFGSRVDAAKKGGDIDLLVVVPEPVAERIAESKALLCDEIQKRIGEQRIDITVATPARMRTDPFLLSIVDEAQLIARGHS